MFFVRALYSFRSDDPTSLSFNQGDMIQVLHQLESGWWDGIVHGQRGWFPSNYCVVVNNADYHGNGVGISPLDDSDTEDGSTSGDEGEDEDSDNGGIGSPMLPMEGIDNDRDPDEATFWIPQATPDGRLFYFNTITGDSRMELPLETPTSTSESGPRDRSNFSAPESTRLPLDMMRRNYEHGDRHFDGDDSSASDHEGEPLFISGENGDESRQSFISEGSSTQSLHSRHSGGTFRTASGESDHTLVNHSTSVSTITSLPRLNTSTAMDHPRSPESLQLAISNNSNLFYEDDIPIPATWDALIESTRQSIERYREAISSRERSQYVRRAEDISDMLRLLIAAGSSTTDNHSGQPSIISTNKPLHPHFRQFMAAFSKLVLSSHIASADFPPPDTEAKCLSEADEVLLGVMRFCEVARTQKKDILPRIKPGFLMGYNIAENWSSHAYQDTLNYSNGHSSNGYDLINVDSDLIKKLEDLINAVFPTLRRLSSTLDAPDSLSTPYTQAAQGGLTISAAQDVVDALKKYFNVVDCMDLRAFMSSPQSPSYVDFVNQRQRLYDSVADLILACQSVTTPIADEWQHIKGEPLDERLMTVKAHLREVESGIQTLGFSINLLVGELEFVGKPIAGKMEESNKPHLDNRPISHMYSPSNSNNTWANTPGAPAAFGHGKGGGESKLIRHFGIEPPAPPAVEPPETPWFLGCDHDHEIMYGKKKEVKGGTLVALVERLTRHDILDSNFISTFLLTYQSFTTADELFGHLAKRFTIQPPLNLSGVDYEMWVDRKQKLIRVRVLSVLKQWMEVYWMENNDEAGKDLLRRLHTFAKDVMLPHLAGTSSLIETIELRLQGKVPEKKVVKTTGAIPAPILPKNMKKLKFLDIDSMEFARQLTIIESHSYRKLKPTDCLNKAWSKPEKPDADGNTGPISNVRSIILHSNQLTNWVAEMILTQPEVRRRVAVIKHFTAIAEKCRQLNNFSTVTSIISALGATPVHRLKRTWDHVPTRTAATLENMKVLMGTTLNFNEYRECLHLVNPPCVPFLGVYLKDLTFVADGNPDFIKGTDLVNFGKRAKTAAIIREIQQYQSVPYGLQPIPELQDYILSNMQTAKDVNEMFNISLALEPREREDEKIARLLQESGFL